MALTVEENSTCYCVSTITTFELFNESKQKIVAMTNIQFLYAKILKASIVKALAWCSFEVVGTEVVGFRGDPYYLRGQPTCCRSTGRSPN